MTVNVLLTGGTGFVGRQIVKQLHSRGCNIRVVSRGKINDHSQLKLDRLDYVTTTDMFSEDVGWFANLCEGIDIVIHAAWYVEPGEYLESEKNIDCLVGTINLARGAVSVGVSKFVGLGTCLEYECTTSILTADTPLKPISLYAHAKVAGFHTLSTVLSVTETDFAWCRLFYLYGQGEDEMRLAPYLHRMLSAGETAELTDGTQVRDYMDVEEVGEMIVGVALGRQTGPVNICSGLPITIRQFAESIADGYGCRHLLHFGARPDNFADPPRIVGLCNYEQV